MANASTLGEIADSARCIREGYRQAVSRYRQYVDALQAVRDCNSNDETDSVFNCTAYGKICNRYWLEVGTLAEKVAQQLPDIFDQLRVVGGSDRWENKSFDWDSAEKELRQIEASALASIETTPVVYLTNWREILVSLGMKNNTEDQSKVRTLNKTYQGPIVFPGQGSQPKAEKTALLSWWNNLAAQWATDRPRALDAAATVAEQYEYGNGTAVIPDISGAVKEKRKVSRKKT